MAAKKKRTEPKPVKSSDVDPKKRVSAAPDVLYDPADPGHRWERPLQAPGHMQVDFEERVDFRRLHDYRLARTRQALAAVRPRRAAVFDQYNIRYITSTVIGEWARDKLTRWSPAHRATASRASGISARRRGTTGSMRRGCRQDHCLAGTARPARRGRVPESGCSSRRRRRSRRSSTRRASPTCRSASTSSSRRCCSRCRSSASRCATASR